MDRKTGVKAVVVLLVLFVSGVSLFSDITIDAIFENGHLRDYKIIQPDQVIVGPIGGDRDTWYSFKIKGVKHKTVTIIFEIKNKGELREGFGGRDAAMVTYDGKGYEIIKSIVCSLKAPGATSGNYLRKFTHVFREDEALVSYAAPWSNTTMAELAVKLKADKRVKISSIGNSKLKNLPLTYFKVTDSSVADKTKKNFFLIGREDAYEVGGSWAVDGVLTFLLSEDPVAKEMLKKMVFYVFPIFSVDGVALGSTNYPYDLNNSNYIYITAQWEKESQYPEIQLMKDFWNKMKREGVEYDVAFKFHACCYAQNHFRPEDCAKDNKPKERELLRLLKKKLSWREEAGPHKDSKGYMNYHFIKVFPKAITYSSHNDFIFSGEYLRTEKNVFRRHEDVIQDGELIARCFGEFYGIETKEVAPYLMGGDVDRNSGKKNDPVTYYVYYYDVNEIPPAKIEVNINGKPYKMTCEKDANYRKPVKYTFKTTLSEPVSDYCFTASNGKKERKMPEDDYLLPGPFIIQ